MNFKKIFALASCIMLLILHKGEAIGDAYVTNNSSPSVSLIDTNSKTVIATLTVGTAPFSIAITPDGQETYITDTGPNNVVVIDTNTKTVIATVTVGIDGTSVAITPDGKEAYVANSTSGNVSIIDTNTKTVIATVTVGIFPGSSAQGIARAGYYSGRGARCLPCLRYRKGAADRGTLERPG